jgi:hypothetical protein
MLVLCDMLGNWWYCDCECYYFLLLLLLLAGFAVAERDDKANGGVEDARARTEAREGLTDSDFASYGEC